MDTNPASVTLVAAWWDIYHHSQGVLTYPNLETMPTNREVRGNEAEADLRYADCINRMTDMFENLLRSHRAERTESFKPSTYNGSGDVELFI